jgi:DNA replicative helicase MCM subunit Mcm2 (Cdc46/Mcm family)
MRLEEELARMKLQQEVALEEARRAAKEKEELLMKAKMSDEARKEYEAKEADRQKKEAQKLAEEKALAEAREKELAA